MQRFSRFDRPGLKGSSRATLTGEADRIGRITVSGILLPDDPDLTVSDYDLIQQRTASTLEFRRSVGSAYDLQYASPASKVSFQTDSTSLEIELYWNGLVTTSRLVGNIIVQGVPVGTFTYAGTQPATTTHTYTLAAGTKTVTILWPVSAGVQLQKVTLTPGSTIKAAVIPTPVIGFAGDSITQGFSVTSAADSWTYGVADSLGWQGLNMAYGFSFATPADATAAFTGKTCGIVTYMIGYNDWTYQSTIPPATYGSNVSSWITNFRAQLPNAKLLLISPIYTTTTGFAIPLSDYRAQMKSVFDAKVGAGDHQIFYLDGLAAMTANANRLADGVHPNDLGSSEIKTSVLTEINRAASNTPTGLTASAVSASQIDLSWSVSGNFTATIVERRSPAGSGAYSRIATVVGPSTTYSDNGLNSSQQYEYRLRAYNMGGESANSASASATTLSGYSISYLIAAGGGSGNLGGGGAGGLLESASFAVSPGTTYTVTVGAGSGANSNGNNSVFAGITATGGGKGGPILTDGFSGGSGGGGGSDGSVIRTGGAGTSGQGLGGGSTTTSNQYPSGGGGGAGQVGETADTDGTNHGGDGGDGLQSSITGTATYYCGGGGGGVFFSVGATAGSGGQGGGGAGVLQANTATNGTVNSGGGGGGTGYLGTAGTGGSGVVILRIPAANYSGTTTGSPTVTDDGSFKVVKFTASGSYTG